MTKAEEICLTRRPYINVGSEKLIHTFQRFIRNVLAFLAIDLETLMPGDAMSLFQSSEDLGTVGVLEYHVHDHMS